MLYRFLLLSLALLPFQSCGAKTANIIRSARVELTDRYTLIFSEAKPDLVRIKAQINLQDSLLHMSPNGPVPSWWPQYIQHLELSDQNGAFISFQKRDSTAWIVEDTYVGETIYLEYEVNIDHESREWPGGIDGVAFVREWGLMASGRALFIVNGDENKMIEVACEKPIEWGFFAPWEEMQVGVYTVQNQIQLLESLLTAGTHQEIALKREAFTLHFVLGGPGVVEQEQEYLENTTKVLDYFIDLMGGVPRPAPGNDLSRVMVIINQGEQMDGEVIGNHISLFLTPEADPQQQIVSWFLFAHEFFHLWNGKSLRFKNTKSDWFKEGISNYYTIKALYNAQMVNEEVIMGVLNGLFYQRYVNDPGFGSLAPADAASPTLKDGHWGLIYGGGLFAGICMDMEIRNNTNNQKSLDDLMRYYYEYFAATDQLIDNTEILTRANQLGQTDFSYFFDTYIMGLAATPLKEYLTHAGVRVDTENKQLTLSHLAEKTVLQEQLWAGFLGKSN